MDPKGLSLATLAGRCREESDKYLRRAPSCGAYCFELFRRAIEGRDDHAWEAILIQYRGIVLAWVRRHPAHAAVPEDDDFWLNRTFERFWRALPPERFARFPSLPDLLTYLKTCANCVLLDEVRARQSRPDAFETTLDDESGSEPGAPDDRLDDLSVRELWEAVIREAKDEAECQVARLSFALDLKPNQIQARHPDLFRSVADVYRVKRNLVERLRRSPDLQAFLGAGG